MCLELGRIEAYEQRSIGRRGMRAVIVQNHRCSAGAACVHMMRPMWWRSASSTPQSFDCPKSVGLRVSFMVCDLRSRAGAH
jgi:hypothetical protein